MRLLVSATLVLLMSGCGDRSSSTPPKAPNVASARRGTMLADLTWLEAERKLTRDAVVVLPLGAAAKEHGPHLRLDNDFVLAEGLRDRLLELEDVVVAPTIPYHYYPAFVEYPGSTTLRPETARDLVVDIVRSLAKHGPKRFYVLNTGVSTVRPLAAAKEMLEKDGIVFGFTDLLKVMEPVEKALLKQEAGTHADEAETSVMLVLAPSRVDMSKAVRDIHPKKPPRLTRDPNGEGTYSRSGVYGDATLATRDKGEALIDAVLSGVRSDLAALRVAAIKPPEGAPTPPASSAPP